MELTKRKLSEFIQVDLRIPLVFRLPDFFPLDFVSLIRRSARHHAGKRRLAALGCLVMEIAACNALNEGLLLFRIGELEVRRKFSRDRESLRLRLVCPRERGSLPGFIAPDAKWSGVGRLRRPFGAEEAFGDVPPAFGKLRGAEGHVNTVRIMEKHVVISVGIPVIRGAALPTASGGRLQRMGFEDPVADVNHENLLFDDDVARKRAIVDPIAQATFGRRRVGPGWPLDVAGKIISFPTDNLAKGAVMDAPDHFDEWRAIANLEPDIQAELSFGALADFNHFQCAGNINRDGLFKIDVLAGVDRSFQMPGMIIRRSGDDDGVQFLGGSVFLVSIVDDEK